MSRKLTREEFVKRAKEIHPEYDYSEAEYVNYSTKLCVICRTHGGFWITPNHLIDGKSCPKCSGKFRYTTQDFIKEARKVHGDKYDYSETKYINAKAKVCIICPEHGRFWQRTTAHLRGQGCPVCAGKNVTTERFIQKAKEVHGNTYDYSNTVYSGRHSPLEIICSVHGSFWQSAGSHLSGRGCPHCRESTGEASIAHYLTSLDLAENADFFRERGFDSLKDRLPLKYDFYLPKENLLIEYNGVQHYEKSTLFQDTRKSFLLRKHHDWLKRKYARDHNIRLLTIPYWEFKNIDKILAEAL